MFFGKRFSGHHTGPFSGLSILVLSIIENYEGISGYEIIQEINQKFKAMWKASPGTIYPLLSRLTNRGFVEVEEIIDENNRQKKIYKITSFGKKRLKEVIKDNLESSMNTLGDFIRTVVHTWMPNEERINRVMACFPFECSLHDIRVDDADYSLANIERIQRKINELEYTRHKVKSRLDEIDKRISENKILLTKLKNMREENMKTIPIVDDEEFENF